MKHLSKFLILSLAVFAFGCKSTPKSQSSDQSVVETNDENMMENEVVQKQTPEEFQEANISQNEN